MWPHINFDSSWMSSFLSHFYVTLSYNDDMRDSLRHLLKGLTVRRIACGHAMGSNGLYFPLLGFIIRAETLWSSGIDFAHGSVPACVPRNGAADAAAVESMRCGMFIS
jgi:hypothetical protein